MKFLSYLLLGTLAVGGLSACRGGKSADPPVHIIGDMDWQPRYQAQGEASKALFADGRAMRPLVDGTVSREAPLPDAELDRGADGEYLAKVPVEVTQKLLDRGQERFNIYCSPCHDKTGSGRGLVVQRGYPPPINLTGDRVRGLRDGEIFHVITNGVRNMPGYRHQIPVEDRWAIVSWLRVLGHSQAGTLADVPAETQSKIEKESTP